MAAIASHHGLKRPLVYYRTKAGTDQRGTTALGLVEAAQHLGFSAKGVKGTFEQIGSVPLPAIAHCLIDRRLLHYVVVTRVTAHHIEVMDPQVGRMEKWSHDRFKAVWTGVLILLTPDDRFRPGDHTRSSTAGLWNLLRPNRGLIALLFATAVLGTVLALATSVYVEMVVDTVIPSGDRTLLNQLAVAMLIVLGFRTVLSVLQSLISLRTAQRIDTALILGYYRHLLRLPQSFFDTMRVGEISARVGDAVKIRHFLNQTLVNLVLHPLIVLCSLGALFIYSRPLALFSLVLLPGTGLLYWLSHARHRTYQRQLMEHGADFGAQFVESLHAQPTIRRFLLEAQAEKKTELLLFRLLKTTWRSAVATLACNTAGTLLTQAYLILLLWFGAGLVLDVGFSLGKLMSCFTLAGFLTGPMASLIGLNTSIQEALVATDRLFEIMDLEREKSDGTRPFSAPLAGEIRLEHISFRHPGRLPTLHDIDLRFPAGQITVLVGESGCGKSTLLSLLQRLYLPEKGRIVFDTIDAADIQLVSLRRHLSVVPQHPVFLSGTLAENIAPGDPQPRMERIQELCGETGLLDFAAQLPQGFLSQLGENGSGLSGGQRQRLALARALYFDAPIFLLDEPTASLDPKSAAIVISILQRLRREGKTVIVAAHDASLVAIADQVVTLARGAVVDVSPSPAAVETLA